MESNLATTLRESFVGLWYDLQSFLPELLLAIVVIIIGWLIGGSLKHVVERVFAKLRVNDALGKAGVDSLAERAGYPLKAGVFVGSLVKWLIIIVFVVAALDILRLDQVNVFFREVVLGYLPQVIVATLILLVAALVSNVASASVRAGARAGGFRAADLLGSLTRYAILLFAILAALNQLHIAPELVQLLFAGFVFGASLALGLAFGLGGKEAASRYIAKLTRHDD